MTALAIVGVIYVCGLLYGAWIGLNILAGADCDHAWLVLAPTIFVSVIFWPLTILFLVYLRLTGGER